MSKKKPVILNISLLLIFACQVSISAANPVHRKYLCKAMMQAFSSGKPGLLNPYLSEDAKVFVSIPEIGIVAGNYSKGQLLVLLKNAFHNIKTQRFVVREDRDMSSWNSPLKAEWVFTRKSERRIFRMIVYITIMKKSGNVVITAMRGSSV